MNARTMNIRRKITAAILTVASATSMLAFPGTAPGALGKFADSISITADAASDSALVIKAGSRMTVNNRYYSPNKQYYVIMQGDGNLVVYTSGGTPIWNTQTHNNTGAFAQLQNDGNFVVYTKNAKALWHAHTHTRGAGCTLNISNDGSLYVTGRNGQKYWTTRTALYTKAGYNGRISAIKAGDIISSPNALYWAVLQGDGNFVVYDFTDKVKYATGTNDGVYPDQLVMQGDGNFVMYNKNGARFCTRVSPYGSGNYKAELDNSGNINVSTESGTRVWSTANYRWNILNPQPKNNNNNNNNNNNHNNNNGQDNSKNQSFLWPSDNRTVTSGFGWRWGTQHRGIDIGAAWGTPVYASKDGILHVECSTCNQDYGKDQRCPCGHCGDYGNHVRIEHGDGYTTRYAHMSSVVTSLDGQFVKQGQVIGYVGCTGWSTGSHLHFEIRKGPSYSSEAINPMQFF